MSVEIPASMLAQADQEVCDLKERIGNLVKSYEALRADGFDTTTAGAWLTAKLAQSPFSRIDLAGLLAVAVSMLTEQPKGGPDFNEKPPKVLTRSVSCTYGCHGGNNDFDCPDHGGMRGIGGAK